MSDVDNVFACETPELLALLERWDLVFAGGPSRHFPIQTSLFSFARNERSVALAREWYRLSKGTKFSDMSGLAYALVDREDGGAQVRVLSRPLPAPRTCLYSSPNNLQVNARYATLRSDWLGFANRASGARR